MAPYQALYGRQCHSLIGWFETGESRLLRADLVRDALKKVKLIQDQLRTLQSRKKSYADQRARVVEFVVGDRVLLRALPMKGVMGFRNLVQLDKDLTYVEEPILILDRQGRKLSLKNIASLKVQWKGQPVEDVTWETEHDMQSQYPYLFCTSAGDWSAADITLFAGDSFRLSIHFQYMIFFSAGDQSAISDFRLLDLTLLGS
ncbi:uncharacterized protein [Nicotiana sylvestris]|uniref:uncharacterized protein n=1 Tax=Nicotiana sylvestris TaxID=4096 RepID=UPI00388CDFB6